MELQGQETPHFLHKIEMDYLLHVMNALSLESAADELCPYIIFLEHVLYNWTGAQ